MFSNYSWNCVLRKISRQKRYKNIHKKVQSPQWLPVPPLSRYSLCLTPKCNMSCSNARPIVWEWELCVYLCRQINSPTLCLRIIYMWSTKTRCYMWMFYFRHWDEWGMTLFYKHIYVLKDENFVTFCKTR